VVAAELDAAPPAAMQAQAVVSRTFALASRKRHAAGGTDLCDLAHCQVYRGATDTKAAREAVEATQGQVLLVGGVTLEPAYFHAACGGHTSRPADVFREKSTSPGVPDLTEGGPACASAPDFSWTWAVEREALAKALGASADGAAFEPLRRDDGGRVLELKSFGHRYQGTEFLSLVGRAFGWQTLRSLHVSATEADQSVRFTGLGTGHGVGLCQTGAMALARKGLGAKAILERYFPQSRVRVP
jgi:stage II sporulation protein D